MWLLFFFLLLHGCDGECYDKFNVAVENEGPLGLRLNDNLEIVQFLIGANARIGEIEAGGLVEIGDRLLSINDISLVNKDFSDAIDIIQQQSAPKVLTFEPYDGRCIVEEQASSKAAKVSFTPGFDGAGYIIIDGTHATESLAAVFAQFGSSIGCDHKEIRFADPSLACGEIRNDIRGAFAFVSSSGGCPIHEKALNIQLAGGKGLIFAGEAGQHPIRISLTDPVMNSNIDIPVVMIRYSGGRFIQEQLRASKHRHSVLHGRFYFSSECLASEGLVDQVELGVSMKANEPLDNMRGGVLLLNQDTKQQLEFLKPNNGPTFHRSVENAPLMVLLEPMGCSGHDETIPMTGLFVIAPLGKCSLDEQALFYHVQGAIAVGFSIATKDIIRLMDPKTPRTIDIPVILLSNASYQIITEAAEDGELHATLEGHDEIALAWIELQHLDDPLHWPSDEHNRKRLFHRVMKIHNLCDSCTGDERYNLLTSAFDTAQSYYSS